MKRRYILAAFGYLLLGLLLGIHMAASHNHGQLVTHAHIMLVGFLLSFCYGACHTLWLTPDRVGLKRWQFIAHQAGTCVMIVGLFLLYGKFVEGKVIEPVLAASSITVLIAAVMMKVDLIISFRQNQTE